MSCGWLLLHMRKPQTCRQPIVVSMKLSRLDTNECVVTMTIVNNEKTNLTFDEDDLPWHVVGESVILALVEEDHSLRNPLGRTLPVMGNPRVTLPAILGAGEVKSNDVHLDAYYGDLITALLHHDVTVVWVYRPRPKTAKQYEPVVGYLRIPRM